MSDLSTAAQGVLSAIRALDLGEASAFEVGNEAVFTIVMASASVTMPRHLQELAERVEDNGYRVVVERMFEATLRVDCRLSERTIGVVSRIGRDGDSTILTLEDASPARLWRLFDNRVVVRHVPLLTQPGDEVVLWRDIRDGRPVLDVCAFRNRTMPAII